MKKLLAALSAMLLLVSFVGCKGCFPKNGEQPNSTSSTSDTTKDNLGNDIEW